MGEVGAGGRVLAVCIEAVGAEARRQSFGFTRLCSDPHLTLDPQVATERMDGWMDRWKLMVLNYT